MTSITLPKSLRKIGEGGFSSCDELKSIVIPEGVTEISANAFYGCKSLTSITLPKSLRKIGWRAFDECNNLSEVHISDVATWCNIEFYDYRSNPLYYAQKLYVSGELFENLVIPEGVTEVSAYAFTDYTWLTSITLPKSLRKIGGGAFDECNNLSEVHISDIAAWCEIEFEGYYSNPLKCAKNLYLNDELVTNLVIPEGVTEIAADAFCDCESLTSITLPKSLREIGASAFDECKNLSEVHISDVTAWCNIKFYDYHSDPLYYAKNLYVNGKLVKKLNIPKNSNQSTSNKCSNHKKTIPITIPEGVTEIDSSTFKDCKGLTAITLPKSLRKIGEDTFKECENLSEVHISDLVAWCGIEFEGYYSNPLKYAKNLYLNDELVTNLVIPEGVTEIAADAFCDCESLTSITLPKSLRKIGKRAFDECNNLSEVHISDIVAWYEIEFEVYHSNPLTYAKKLYLNSELLTTLVIPEDVTEIASAAFQGCKSLTSITLPQSLRKIGKYAFYGCTGLSDIIIPEGVTEIAANAFSYCENLTSITLPTSLHKIGGWAFEGCDGLPQIIIPEGVTEISVYAFYGCKSLTSITLPKSLRKIGDSAFGRCAGLTEIIISEDVIEIDSQAFYGCTNLGTITLPTSLREIGEDAFKECKNLSEVHISDIAAWCEIEFWANYKNTRNYSNPLVYAKNLYLNGELLTTLVIPEDVTEIASAVFQGCKSLTSITLPKSLRKIGNKAFDECNNLSEVHISDITAWCGIEFNGCHSNPLEYAKTFYVNGELLTTLIIPEDVSQINNHAFSYYKDLRSLIVPTRLSKIGSAAFCSCTNLTTVLILNDIEEIGDGAFEGCSSLLSLTLPQNVKIIHTNAFSGCISLTSLTLPEGIIEIASFAFSGCESLTSITLSTSLRKIGSRAFAGCKNLSEVHISDVAAWCNIEFESYSSNPLYYAKNLYVNGELVTKLILSKGKINNFQEDFPYYQEHITTIVISEDVTEILPNAFSRYKSYKNLTSVTLPKSLRKIRENAFGKIYDGHINLSEVHISDVAAWCNIEFYDYRSNPLEYAKKLYVNGELFENFVVPEGVTEISAFAFYGCKSLTSITLPKSLRKIGHSAFGGCKNLSEVHISDVTSWCNIEFKGSCSNPLEYAEKLYLNGELVKKIVVQEGVTAIPIFAFCGCAGLTEIIIPEGVTEIASSAFCDCKGLTSITLPTSLRKIGNKAFYGCKGLTSIVIPEGVTEITESTFEGCYNLASITLPKSLRKIEYGAFKECENLSEVHISDITAWCNIESEEVIENPYGEPPQRVYRPRLCAKSLYLNGELITNLITPKDVKRISPYSFYGYENIVSVVISEGVIEIGEYAFSKCTRIKTVTLPKSLEIIQRDSFSECENLSQVHFSQITSLKNAIYGIYIGPSAFSSCTALRSVTIYSVNLIDCHAFSGCTSLTTITIFWLYGVYISEKAFSSCTQLTSATFFNIDKLFPVRESIISLARNVSVYKHIQEIRTKIAMYNADTVNINLPDICLPYIDYRAFERCTRLTSIIFDTNPSAQNKQIPTPNISGYAFDECPNLMKFAFPYSAKDKFIHPEEYCKTHRLDSSRIKLPFDLLLLRSGWDIKRTTEESQDDYDEQDFSSDYDEGPHEVWDWIDREDLSDPDDPLHNL